MSNSTDSIPKILQDYGKEKSSFLSNCRPPSYEESHFKQMADDVKVPLEEQVKSIQSIAESADKLATDSKEIAKSAKTCSNIALSEAKKADIKGWISIGIAAFGTFTEFAIHHSEVIDFVKSILGV